MKEKAIKYYNEIKKFYTYNKKWLFSVLIISFLVYGVKISHYSIGIDTEKTINDINFYHRFWLGLGRWSVVIFGKFFYYPNRYNPFITSLLIPIFLSFFVFLMSYLFCKIVNKRKYDKYIILFLGSIILTSPAILEMMNFLLMSAEFSLGFVFLGISVILTYFSIYIKSKNKILMTLKFLLTICFLSLTFGFYQAFFQLYIGLVAIMFIFEKNFSSNDRTLKNDIMIICKMICIFLTSLLLWKFITFCFKNLYNLPTSSYLSDQITWGKISVNDSIQNILDFIKSIIFPNIKNSLYNYSYFIIIVLSVIFIIKKMKNEKKFPLIYFISLLFILISPFIISIILGYGVANRVMINIPVVVACIFVLFFTDKYTSIYEKYILCFLVIFTFLIQFKTSYDLLYSDFIRYDEDKRLIQDIFIKVDMLEGLNGNREKKKIIFTSAHSSKSPGASFKGDCMGYSFFEWDLGSPLSNNDRIFGLAKTMGYRYIMPTSKDIKKAQKISKSMNPYPDKGSIIINNNNVIVKLS